MRRLPLVIAGLVGMVSSAAFAADITGPGADHDTTQSGGYHYTTTPSAADATAPTIVTKQHSGLMHTPREPNVGKHSSLTTGGDDDNISTTAAPLGVNQKGDVGAGVEARMPGAAGR